MSAVTLTCPSCKQIVTTESAVCPRCGGSVAAELFAARAEALGALTRQMSERNARRPRSGGSTVNGWGTTLLDYQPRGDGTWNAVRWFTVAALPLVPLRGVHLRPIRREGHNMHERLLYDVIDETKPYAASVLRTYGWALAGLVPVLLFFFWGSMVKRLFGTGPLAFFVGLALIAWAIVVMVRIHNSHKAFRTAGDSPATG
jgi:hypothetical protein